MMRAAVFAIGLWLLAGVAAAQPFSGHSSTASGSTAALAAQYPISAYGAKSNEAQGVDGTVSAGSSAFCSSSTTFTAADVGKSFALNASGAAGVDQSGTISAFVSAHCVTLSFSAVLATPYVGASKAAVATSQSGGGSYAPGDTLTASGGTGVVTAPVFTITHTQVASAAVNAGGTPAGRAALLRTARSLVPIRRDRLPSPRQQPRHVR